MNDFPQTAPLIGMAVMLCCAWLALLYGMGKGVGWLMGRNSRVAVLLGCAPFLLLQLGLAWLLDTSPLDGQSTALTIINAICLLVAAMRLLQLRKRPLAVPESPPRPALPKPPARPLLPRGPSPERIEAARRRIKGPV